MKYVYIVSIEGSSWYQRVFSSKSKCQKWMNKFLKMEKMKVIAESDSKDEHSWSTEFRIISNRKDFVVYNMRKIPLDDPREMF